MQVDMQVGTSVETLHRNRESYDNFPIDFWPNEGKDQPECPPGGFNIYN